jgi:hypothetical protein
MSRPGLLTAATTTATTAITAITVFVVFIAVALTGAPAAFASFTSTPAATLTIGTVSIQAPNQVTASVNCTTPTTLTLSWTPPTGTNPTSYTITAIKNQTGSTRTNTVPATTTNTSFNIPNWTSYTIQIQAAYNTWTSTTTSQNGTVPCP